MLTVTLTPWRGNQMLAATLPPGEGKQKLTLEYDVYAAPLAF